MDDGIDGTRAGVPRSGVLPSEVAELLSHAFCFIVFFFFWGPGINLRDLHNLS